MVLFLLQKPSIYAGFGTFGVLLGTLLKVPLFLIQTLSDPFFPFEIGPRLASEFDKPILFS
jgi:hypothetical protein